MTAFTTIVIIYNPNSTGSSQEMAESLKQELKVGDLELEVQLKPTQYAGHAEKIAYEAAKKHSRPVIVSVSGDGGYHEVINGAMKAQNEGASPICAVVGAGNANDHRSALRQQPMAQSILEHETKRLDLLEFELSSPDKGPVIRYAHSYGGLGLTPVVAVELNRHTLSAWREFLIVIKTFHKFAPFTIEHDRKIKRLDSLIFSNINRMAKVLTLAQDGSPDDGKFEINFFPHRHKIKLLFILAKAATVGLKPNLTTDKYEFTVQKKSPMQLDGEVISLDPLTKVKVTIKKQVITTII